MNLHGALDLVSADAGGGLRFRLALAAAEPEPTFRWEDLLVAGPNVVVSYAGRGRCRLDHHVEARSIEDGAIAWRHTLGEDSGAVADCRVHAGDLASGGAAIALHTQRCGGPTREAPGSCAGALEALASDDGRTLWSVPTGSADARDAHAVADEDGNFYAHAARLDSPGARALLSVAPDGSVRYHGSAPPALSSLEAVASGAIVAGAIGPAALVLDARNGDLAVALDAYVTEPVVAGTLLFTVTRDHLQRLPLGFTAPDWSVALAPSPSTTKASVEHAGPILTDAGTLLVVDQQHLFAQPALPAVLREVDVAGAPRSSTGLAGVQRTHEIALGDGTLHVLAGSTPQARANELRAYALPGRRPASHGWIAARGGMARDRRSR